MRSTNGLITGDTAASSTVYAAMFPTCPSHSTSSGNPTVATIWGMKVGSATKLRAKLPARPSMRTTSCKNGLIVRYPMSFITWKFVASRRLTNSGSGLDPIFMLMAFWNIHAADRFGWYGLISPRSSLCRHPASRASDIAPPTRPR